MAQHNNFKKDVDMLSEAYTSVSGNIPDTSTTAIPRMLNEGEEAPYKGGNIEHD